MPTYQSSYCEGQSGIGKDVLETLRYPEASGVRLCGALPTEPEQVELFRREV